MNWSNVKLILTRELRDQARDRRTIFMIAVLPILLYPLLGMSMFQVAQFMEEKASRVLVVGVSGLLGREDLPPLLEAGDSTRFDKDLFHDAAQHRLLEVTLYPEEPTRRAEPKEDVSKTVRALVRDGKYDGAIVLPPELPDQLAEFRRAIEQDETTSTLQVQPEIVYSTANEKSQIAFARLYPVMKRWVEAIGETNLKAAGIPPDAARPVDVGSADVAGETKFKGAAIWSKVLPIVLLLWAMTGAFYPAIDLCAGEKERGTLETLLSSPAERSEIVLGKLLTVMVFSMATAALNLVSMGLTGWLILSRMPHLGSPPAESMVWLTLALVPVAALYSALCLALAAFAKSTKEGQYYLMPLLLITMPLVLAPMTPGAELDLGNALVPVTGIVLLLRNLLEGAYWESLRYLPVVGLVTLACCVASIRWAIEQFNSEAVLFRESERLDLGLWLKHVFRDRQPTPTISAAVVCGVSILVVKFFIEMAATAPGNFRAFAVQAVMLQVAVILTPALILTFSLTTSPAQTLRLRLPRFAAVPAAILLALLLHPVIGAIRAIVMELYPIREDLLGQLEGLQAMFVEPPVWQALLVIALAPAVCEELAFRGFVLSGFRHLGRKWRAILLSAVFFGLAHGLLQQSLIAFLVGTVIGYIAVQTGSIWPGIAFHLVNNSIGVLVARVTPELQQEYPILLTLFGAPGENGALYSWPVVLVSGLLALGLLAWFSLLPVAKSEEELQRELIARIRDTGPEVEF
ncbi:MAG: CPBP family intramembrane metalloprotease [Planctomycetaceae bacterium]|nr:CPBP family intramembrane metalloprotease [Planctomycetaceae bacterium]